MNVLRRQRSEEARRQAMAVTLEERKRQSEAAHERAMAFAIETQRVEDLRALRLARAAKNSARQPGNDIAGEPGS